jgi:uncharacterized protein involved in exopolysaccharide biosynthesis
MGEEKQQVSYDNEIDLMDLFKCVWKKKLFVAKVTIAFLLLGLVIVFSAKVEYKATAKLMSESQNAISPDLGGLGGLAGLAGFNLNMGQKGSLAPEIYPEIVKSSTFVEKLINAPLYFEKLDTVISGFTYFKEYDNPSLFGLVFEYTIGLPRKIRNSFTSSRQETTNNYDLIRYSKADWEILQGYADRLTVSVDSKTGVVTIETEMPDPVAAAITADMLVKGLTERIIRYKIEKLEINFQFIKERFQEAKLAYEINQSKLAEFTDRNLNISNALIQTEYQRLQNQLNISFEVYKGLATQLEQAKIQVKEETPVFTVLEPVRVPVEKSKPKRIIILFISSFLGLSFGILWAILKS